MALCPLSTSRRRLPHSSANSPITRVHVKRHSVAVISDRLDIGYPHLEFDDEVHTVTATTRHSFPGSWFRAAKGSWTPSSCNCAFSPFKELHFDWLTKLMTQPEVYGDMDTYLPDSLPPRRRQPSPRSSRRPSIELPQRPGQPTGYRLPPSSTDMYRPDPQFDVYRPENNGNVYRPDVIR
ncbi:hypothetical protein BCR44DRAFT_266837 [Catenaria anguillulae PL171]|uniref:Uncharacterized protein n=1 Tax=Catenaria anguillulae PL171 TaxID=765915 RepID=A0A1Y2HBX1_9FUNG|nr:hypothetical protein BCR44DRAFT_266837 [Catenaria anguillulae PL171]